MLVAGTRSRWSAAAAAPCGGGCCAGRRLAAARATAQQRPFPSETPPPSTQSTRPREHLRVLRYPNGDERVIRYPAYAPPATEEGGARAASVSATAATATTTSARRANANANAPSAAPAAGSGDSGSSSGNGSVSSTLDDYLSWDVTGLWSLSSARPQAPSQADERKKQSPSPPPPLPPSAASEEQQQQQQQEDQAAATSSGRAADAGISDADYLESLFAAAYAQPAARPLAPKKGTSSRPAVADDGDASASPLPAGTYQVLTGCPWPAPRPLYTLALRHSASAAAAALAARLRASEEGRAAEEDEEQRDDAKAGQEEEEDRVGSTYTLSVRSRDHGAASDLARALAKGADWAARMDVGARRDGVVAFGSERDARRYARLLESPLEPGGGHSGVAVARVDSHALFRAIGDVKSVVVYLPPCGAVAAAAAFEAGGENESDSDSADDSDGRLGAVPRPHQLAAALLRE